MLSNKGLVRHKVVKTPKQLSNLLYFKQISHQHTTAIMSSEQTKRKGVKLRVIIIKVFVWRFFCVTEQRAWAEINKIKWSFNKPSIWLQSFIVIDSLDVKVFTVFANSHVAAPLSADYWLLPPPTSTPRL